MWIRLMRALAFFFSFGKIYKNPARALLNTVFLLLFPFLLYFIGGFLLVGVFMFLIVTAWIRHRKETHQTS